MLDRLEDHEQLDLIILDIMMPHLDGLEVCQVIRDRVSCPILFLSARSAEADRIRGLAVGGDDYIVKPFSMQELKARIRAHLRREQRVHLGVITSYSIHYTKLYDSGIAGHWQGNPAAG